ncbi:Pyruvate carboxyl transferase [Mucinivorans hirudinis]|uniref:Pyruvate carboxyl transferase n=1 Tax=Mucinivorans hirudinis TaxID=1433126 RepID=A0A060RB09_9BACT|nr:Pyruvate carboxyl transferase [Mucinivorans hirudinis]
MKELFTENGTYTTTFTKKYEQRKPWQPANPKQVLSYIPGTIISVAVSEGQSVEEGDTLLMFNAMKMNNTMRSPMGGKIKVINVKEGDAVAKGLVLLEFE